MVRVTFLFVIFALQIFIIMRKVIGIGETVLDIIFKQGKPVSALPGGSTFNAIISLARSGVNTTFISETGNDRVGDQVINFMKKNGVSSDNVSVFPDSRTPCQPDSTEHLPADTS